jgi:hypothetical protein
MWYRRTFKRMLKNSGKSFFGAVESCRRNVLSGQGKSKFLRPKGLSYSPE